MANYENVRAQTLENKVDTLTRTVNKLSHQFELYINNPAYGPHTVDSAQEHPTYVNTESQYVEGYQGYHQDFSKDENESRGNWSGRLDFLLACLGYAVGLGNVWRFPYLAYKNGGAVFLIPYVIMLVFVGMPIFFLELSLGQYTSASPVTAWNMALIFKGLGVGMLCVSFMVATYYNIIIAWAIYYLFASFTTDLPWTHCDREWNTPFCAELLRDVDQSNCTALGLLTATDGVCYNGSVPYGIFNASLASDQGISKTLAADEYFNRKVLGIDREGIGFEDMGTFQWQLILCHLLSWIIIIGSLIKGVKSSGKVVYFTALFPYVVLVILFGYGISLEGSYDGIRFYLLEPDFEKLKDAQVWKDAAVQIFFSLGSSFGGLIALSSYNRFHNDCLRDTLIISIGNCSTSFFAGFVIFSYVVYLARQLGVDVPDVTDVGTGLAFVIYPTAVSQLPISTLWAILFFLMLITLGLDSEFAFTETVTTSIMDQWPSLHKKKSLVVICTGMSMFLLALPMCMQGGVHLLTLMDDYAGGWNVLVIAFLECVCIAYVYGAYRFKEDIRVMLGPTGCCCFPWGMCFPWWMLCWAFFTPLGVLFVLIFSWVDYTPSRSGDYEYELWANILGWLMTFTVIVAIFGTALILMCMWDKEQGFFKRLRYLTTPNKWWGPALVKHRRKIQHLPNFHIDPYTPSN